MDSTKGYKPVGWLTSLKWCRCFFRETLWNWHPEQNITFGGRDNTCYTLKRIRYRYMQLFPKPNPIIEYNWHLPLEPSQGNRRKMDFKNLPQAVHAGFPSLLFQVHATQALLPQVAIHTLQEVPAASDPAWAEEWLRISGCPWPKLRPLLDVLAPDGSGEAQIAGKDGLNFWVPPATLKGDLPDGFEFFKVFRQAREQGNEVVAFDVSPFYSSMRKGNSSTALETCAYTDPGIFSGPKTSKMLSWQQLKNNVRTFFFLPAVNQNTLVADCCFAGRGGRPSTMWCLWGAVQKETNSGESHGQCRRDLQYFREVL